MNDSTKKVRAPRDAPCSSAIIACACVLMLACGSGTTEQAPPGTVPFAEERQDQAVSSGEVVPGYAVFGHEVRTIRPCGADEALWAVDNIGTLWALHQELSPDVQPYEELFVVIEGRWGPPPADGFGSDYPEALYVDRVLYAGVEGPACDADWKRFDFRALGNEPFWSAEVTAGGIRFSRMGETDLLWTSVTRESESDGVRYSGDGDAALGPIELLIAGEPCRDTMSGAYFGFSARLRLDGEELGGCALKGARPPG